MKKFALYAFAASAALSLSACGSSDSANEQATPDTVEMPAEEQLSTVAAQPVPDSGADATQPADPNAGAKAEDAAANAAAAAADFNAAGDGAEKAIDKAEKKM
jgi:hypothetical protein